MLVIRLYQYFRFLKAAQKNGPSVETAALNDCLPYENSYMLI